MLYFRFPSFLSRLLCFPLVKQTLSGLATSLRGLLGLPAAFLQLRRCSLQSSMWAMCRWVTDNVLPRHTSLIMFKLTGWSLLWSSPPCILLSSSYFEVSCPVGEGKHFSLCVECLLFVPHLQNFEISRCEIRNLIHHHYRTDSGFCIVLRWYRLISSSSLCPVTFVSCVQSCGGRAAFTRASGLLSTFVLFDVVLFNSMRADPGSGQLHPNAAPLFSNSRCCKAWMSHLFISSAGNRSHPGSTSKARKNLQTCAGCWTTVHLDLKTQKCSFYRPQPDNNMLHCIVQHPTANTNKHQY